MGGLILPFAFVAIIVFIGLPILMIWIIVKILPKSFKLMKIRLKKIDEYIEANEQPNKPETTNRKYYSETGYSYNEETHKWEPPR